MILGRRPDHRRPANIDILDTVRIARTRCGNLFERIEIDHHQINRLDGVLCHGLGMCAIITNGQYPAMDRRMQRLYPPIHDFGKSGGLRYITNRNACGLQR